MTTVERSLQMKECKELIEESAKLLGRIDVLVNNAGEMPGPNARLIARAHRRPCICVQAGALLCLQAPGALG